ncbi:MAG: 30S ribosomal protein S20 [candidate division WOR-3 bacterium]
MARKKSLSVLKRERQNEKRRMINRLYKLKIKNLIKKIRKTEKEEERKALFVELQSIVDKAVKRGVIHENKGSRIKSKVFKKLFKTKS